MRPCCVPGCERTIRSVDLMCRKHWCRVDPETRTAIERRWDRYCRMLTASSFVAFWSAVEQAKKEAIVPRTDVLRSRSPMPGSGSTKLGPAAGGMLEAATNVR